MDKRNCITRRKMLRAAAAAGAVGVTAAFASPALAAEDVSWDAEYDVVVLGMGFAGMAAAMAAADAGASVLICEKMDEGHSGGNSRYCGQLFAYGNGDKDATLAYYKALAGGRSVPDDMLELLATEVSTLWDTIADRFGLDAEEFVDNSGTPFIGPMSPEYPELEGAGSISLCSTHDGFADAYLFNHLRELIADNYGDKIDVWFEAPGLRLVCNDEGGVSGVVVGGQSERYVHAAGGVVIATGGYEDNPRMVQDFLDITKYGVAGGLYNTGDGISMCLGAGARLWHASVYEGATGPLGCGYYSDAKGNIAQILDDTLYTGSSLIVGDAGRRFGNEGLHTRHGHTDLRNGVWDNPAYPEHMWVVYDQAQKDAVDASGSFNEDYRDNLREFDSVESAAAFIGCDAEVLRETIADFNSFCEAGKDYQFGRSAETMRALEGDKVYLLPIMASILNTQGGPERNASAQVIGLDGEPIPGLYSAGECGGITVCMYQGGTNVAECLIFGNIAGTNAAKTAR